MSETRPFVTALLLLAVVGLTLLLATLRVVGAPDARVVADDDRWIVVEPDDATPADAVGRGRTIVLVSGDEEYRSEEALPALANVLARRHGFRCVVLFAIDPATGVINPDDRTSLPGLHQLADADAMLIATRFRDLSDEDMAHVDAFVRSGRPIIGLRTATHAFNLRESSSYRHYTWNHDGSRNGTDGVAGDWTGGFGRAILGETWIAHHGAHGKESTRGIVVDDAHPIVRGIEPGSIWGPTDVYRVRLPLPRDCHVVVDGAILTGMARNDAVVEDDRNDPMMPLAWTRTTRADGVEGRVFTTTLGAASDFVAEGSRRLVVQGVLWAMGLEDSIPAGGVDVTIGGGFAPTAYGFGGYQRGIRPSDRMPRARVEGQSRVMLLGNTTAERLAQSGALELLLHAAMPETDVTLRQVPWSADELLQRPRETNVPPIESHLERFGPDLVIAAYGASESWDDGLDVEDATRRFLANVRASVARGGGATPRIVLLTPLDPDPSGSPDLDDGWASARRVALEETIAAMRRAAAADGGDVAIVDLGDLDVRFAGGSAAPLTTNGVHPTDAASVAIARRIGSALGWVDEGAFDVELDEGTRARARDLRRLACEKHWYERLVYRPTNTEYVWGRRAKPFGVVNFPPEWAQLERMIDARDRAIRDSARTLGVAAVLAAPAASDVPLWETVPDAPGFAEDSWTPPAVEAKGTETSLGSLEIAPSAEFVTRFETAPGYVIECFASEEDFDQLRNPLAMAFDARGRLWVLCAGTYPHLLPGNLPECQLVVIEDTDGDGRADDLSVFADRLMTPTGFAIDVDAVYVGQAPDLLKLTDTDGDGRADRREIVASGFGMCDSHHQISAFEWDPAGGFVMHEGVFTKSNVETAWGTRRIRDAAVWRYDPRSQRTDVLAHAGYSNPWGHVFDDFGLSILADASGGANVSFQHAISPYVYPHKPRQAPVVLNRGRPTAGCELIASRHFPDDVQETFLVNQSIGFHGTRWDHLKREGSTLAPDRSLPDIVKSNDTNFRPVAMEIGPDGALYIADWCNPIIGHMQYSVRDPRRDNSHGRIWRVRHESRPLLDPPNVAEATTTELFGLLRLPERNTRQLARLRLQRMDAATIIPEFDRLLALVQPADPHYERLVVESIWLRQAHGRYDAARIAQALELAEPSARAASIRAVRHGLQQGAMSSAAAEPLLARAATDESMIVRLEGVVAAGFLGEGDPESILELAASRPMDGAMATVLEEVVSHLARTGVAGGELARRVELSRMETEAFLTALESAEPGDALIAGVALRRRDVPLERRESFLRALTADDEAAMVDLLVVALDDARETDAQDAIGDLLRRRDREALVDRADDLLALADESDVARGSVIVAALLTTGAPESAERPREDTLLAASRRLDDGALPEPAHVRLSESFRDGRVVTRENAVEIARHSKDPAVTAAWLSRFLESIEGERLSEWSSRHERGMAALAGLHELDASAWPESTAGMRQESVDEARLARGAAIYHDAEVGCVRCHAADGRGLEGFPPLDRSPWIVGTPERAASIVVHGLVGPIRLPDGRRFESAMAPLGELLDDEEIADVLTYVRRSWGNYASPVDAATVARARATAPSSGGAWTAVALESKWPLFLEELDEVHPMRAGAPTLPSLGPVVLLLVGMIGLPMLVVAIAKMR